MSEHRKVTLVNLENQQEVEVTAVVKDLHRDDRESIADEHLDESAVAQAAERALIAYRKEHPGDYLVVGIERGEA